MKRASLAPFLCAVLLLATGFAAVKKSERHPNWSSEGSDLSLQNGSLLDVTSSVSGGAGNLTLSQDGGFRVVLTLPPGTPNDWNGGTGNWSDAGNWSAGLPGNNSDVLIYSGSNDNVTLDTSSTINTLTLGGATGSSTLQGGPTLSSLTIAGALTIGQTGTICACATGGFGTITAGSLVNNGMIFSETSGVLQINGDANNSGFLQTGFETGGHMVNITGTLTNGGLFQLIGPGDMATIGSASNSGTIDVEGFFAGATFKVNGDVANSGTLATNEFGGSGGGNTITINGMLTNQGGGQFILYGPGDMASIGGGMNNSGTVDVDNGSTLNITGDVTNSGTIQTDPGGNTISITGMLTNSGTFQLSGPGDMAIVGGNLVNSGFVDVEGGSTLQVNGDASNSANLLISNLGTGGNKLNINGMLTNSGSFELLSPGDIATIGAGLTNDAGGFVIVNGGSKLTITGDVTNSGNLETAVLGGGGNNTVNINGMLTNSGTLQLNGPGDTANIIGPLTNESSGNFTLLTSTATFFSGMSNAGFVDVDGFSSLTITGDVTNNGMLVTGANISAGGDMLIITGNLANAGNFELRGLEDMATIGSLNNSATGTVVVEYSASLQINGDATNFGIMETKFLITGQNTLNIAGMLTNESGGQFVLGGGLDISTIGSVTNAGTFEVTLEGTANIGNGMGTALTNNPGGLVDVEGVSRLTITGDVINSGTMATNMNSGGGMNTIAITGMLTNQGGGQFILYGPGDMASIGGSVTNNGSFQVLGNGSTATIVGDMNVGIAGGTGSLTLMNGATVTNQNGFVGSGAGSSGTVLVSANGSSWLNLGNLSVGVNGGSGLLTVNNGGTVSAQVLTIGTLGEVDPKAGGNLNYTMLNNSGILDPVGTGNLIGTLLTVFPQGSTVFDVLGKAPGQYGQLDITGSALFDGKTVIDFMHGFAPKKGDMFDFINITGSGDFSGDTIVIEGLEPGFEYSVDFSNGEFTLTALNDGVPLPEPSTLLVLIPALLGVGYGLRRRLLQ